MPEEKQQRQHKNEGITRITVSGFKSIAQEQNIEIRPLTILAGANSSGKSSIMQPLLLLKQKLDATYNPGALPLNDPNVHFTSVDQLLYMTSNKHKISIFSKSLTNHTFFWILVKVSLIKRPLDWSDSGKVGGRYGINLEFTVLYSLVTLL